MNGEMDCGQVRELAPDLAIGIADGHERDAVLRHVAACPECRTLVAELSSVVDDLLLLAPVHERPDGFASRTVARMTQSSPRSRRGFGPPALEPHAVRRPLAALAVAASIVAALVLGAGAVYQGTSDDRRLADSYRSVLSQGNGSFFAAAPLRSLDGARGIVYGYEGEPSWMFATLNRPPAAPEQFRVWLVTRDGRRLALGETVLGGSQRSWGTQLPVKLSQVAQIRFEASTVRSSLVAYVTADDPWGSS